MLKIRLDGPAHELRSPLIGQARLGVVLGPTVNRFKTVMLSGVTISSSLRASRSVRDFNRRVLLWGPTVKITKTDTIHTKQQSCFATKVDDTINTITIFILCTACKLLKCLFGNTVIGGFRFLGYFHHITTLCKHYRNTSGRTVGTSMSLRIRPASYRLSLCSSTRT
jgi:hypothetical protein